MSCSLCRLPFTPGGSSIDCHPPPPGVLTGKMHNYYRWGQAMGSAPGAVVDVEWLGRNTFSNPRFMPMSGGIGLSLIWDAHGGTIVVCHTVCALVLRAAFDVENDSVESLTVLCQIEKVLGRPQDGLNGGRFRGIDYEGVGAKVDLRPYWKYNQYNQVDGSLVFDWLAFKSEGHAWLLNRPGVFPRFRPKVAEERLAFGPSPSATSDIVTTQPLDLLHILLPYLSDATFVSLLSTCRLLRLHALTTFQPLARRRVLALGWAIPLQSEYAHASAQRAVSGRAPIPMAHAQDSPHDGDWMLYLSQAYRSPSMRVRRHVWALARELRRAYEEALPGSTYADTLAADGSTVKSSARIALEQETAEPYYMMRRLANGEVSRAEMIKIVQEVGLPLPH